VSWDVGTAIASETRPAPVEIPADAPITIEAAISPGRLGATSVSASRARPAIKPEDPMIGASRGDVRRTIRCPAAVARNRIVRTPPATVRLLRCK
jgi:hypothetical protein